MSEPPTKRDTKSLVSSLLGTAAPVMPAPGGTEPGADAPVLSPDELATASSAAASALAPPGVDIEREARELIEVYFELEEPAERDVVFDRLVALDTPSVADFLRVMMAHDGDEFVRAAAACELAARGDADAVAALEADLADPEELYFFENALDGLSRARGAAFYDTARELWLDAARDADERRAAMLTLESLDTSRALADFEAFVAAQTDLARMPDAELEVVMAAFARHGHRRGVTALQALRERIRGASDLDADERDELAAFVQEGIDLIETEL